MTITHTTKFRTKAQIVFEELRRRIDAGDLPPGERLVLKSLADEFDYSETPVREALRLLEAGGFIDLIPHSGAHVSGLKMAEIVELTEIRALLEPEATCEAALHLTADDFAQLDRLIGDMAVQVDKDARMAYGLLNRRFHALILDACPRRHLVGLINDLWDRAERGRAVYLKGTHFLSESLAQHREIVRLAKARDIEALRALSMRHSQYGLDAVRSLAAWNPGAETKLTGS